ncbi:cytochrome c peroxidase [Roseateles toxinivorans]|uniref:cytochrome c peroxidase n=1 Tax=Roseateles toxinivorans TaxID=270368 RepID=UPI00105DF402|nr:cytochrome c peroxidase [Roseateles toxinivorans]
MPAPATAHGPWFFWDGRKDSLWSPALGPLEDGLEHGSNRARLVQQLQAHHRADYEMVFGPIPMLAKLAADAGARRPPRPGGPSSHATARPWPIASRSACRTRRHARWLPSCAAWQAR